MKKVIMLAMIVLFCSWQVALSQKTITGKVTSSDDGLPIPGASVLQQGTTRGVSTDVNGLYSISVPDGATLVFSAVGMMDQEVVVGTQDVINVILQPSTIAVDEVVVTALGITKEKKALGYSVTELPGDELTVGTSVSPVNVLQGKATGVLITNTDGGVFGGTRIVIRGNSTLGSNNQPIFIVDGVMIDNETSGGSQWGGSDWGNNLKNLNPDDFETVSLLKGSAATALYGSRALNGVILITTKKGRQRQGIGLEITHTLAVETVYDGHHFQNEFGFGEITGYADWYSSDQWGSSYDFPKNVAGEWDLREIGAYNASWGPKMEGQQVRSYDGTWTTLDPRPTNYLDAFQLGVQNNTNVSLQGGDEKTNYRVSYSLKDHNGVYPGNRTKRNSVSANFGHEIVKGLRLDMNIAYVTSDNYNPPNRGVLQQFITYSFDRSYDAKKWMELYKAPHGGLPQESYGDTYWQVPGMSLWYSIFENIYQQTEDNTRVRGTVTATLADWLTLKIGGTYNVYNTRYEAREPGQGYQNAGGYYALNHSKKFQTAMDAQLIFSKELAPNLNMSFVLGGESFSTLSSGTSAHTNGGLDPVLMYALTASVSSVTTSAYRNGEYQYFSAYYILNLDYKNQFYFDMTGRNDFTSAMVYKDGTGKYSYFYPSFTGSWIFSETFDLPAAIDFGKVRLGYAIVGTSADPYEITTPFTFTKGENPLQTLNGSVPYYRFSTNTVPNPDLQPEKKHEIEFGVDIRFFKNRLGLDFTYYNSHTYNQILPISVPAASGVSATIVNAGDIQNKGVEITLHTTPVRTNDLTWDLDINYTRNRNMIVDLHSGVEKYGLYESGTYGNTRIGTYAIIGGEWGVLMSDSSPQMDEETGLPILVWNSYTMGARTTRTGVLQKVGSMNPDFYGSVNTTLTYKNFSLNVLIDGKIGGKMSTYSGRYGTGQGLWESTLYGRDEAHGGITWTSALNGITYHDGMIPDGVFADGTTVVYNGVTNNVGGMTYREAYDQGLVEPMHAGYWYYGCNSWGAGAINEHVLSDNSYISLREVSLGYHVPSKVFEKMGLQDVRILLYGRNLTYLYNAMTDHLHPEAQTSNEAGAAHEWTQIPYSRTIGCRINLNF